MGMQIHVGASGKNRKRQKEARSSVLTYLSISLLMTLATESGYPIGRDAI